MLGTYPTCVGAVSAVGTVAVAAVHEVAAPVPQLCPFMLNTAHTLCQGPPPAPSPAPARGPQGWISPAPARRFEAAASSPPPPIPPFHGGPCRPLSHNLAQAHRSDCRRVPHAHGPQEGRAGAAGCGGGDAQAAMMRPPSRSKQQGGRPHCPCREGMCCSRLVALSCPPAGGWHLGAQSRACCWLPRCELAVKHRCLSC